MRWASLAMLLLGCHNAPPSTVQEPAVCIPDPLRDPDDRCPGGYIVVDNRDKPDAGLQRICIATVMVDGVLRPCVNKR